MRSHTARLDVVEDRVMDREIKPIVRRIATARGVDEHELLERTRARVLQLLAEARTAGVDPMELLARRHGMSAAAYRQHVETRLADLEGS